MRLAHVLPRDSALSNSLPPTVLTDVAINDVDSAGLSDCAEGPPVGGDASPVLPAHPVDIPGSITTTFDKVPQARETTAAPLAVEEELVLVDVLIPLDDPAFLQPFPYLSLDRAGILQLPPLNQSRAAHSWLGHFVGKPDPLQRA